MEPDQTEAWRIATPAAQKWLTETFTDHGPIPVLVAPLGYRHTHLGRVDWPDSMKVRQPNSVGVHADLDGFLVNPHDDHGGFGVEFINLLPVGERGLGLFIPNGRHPMEPGWADDVRPRLEAAVQEAVDHVLASMEGHLCGDDHPEAPEKYRGKWKCMRPAGHTTRSGWRALHAMGSGHLWTVDGVRVP